MVKLQGLPQILLRAFSEERYALDFVSGGKLRFGELGRYRKIEDGSRRDSSEGYGHYVDAQSQQWHMELGGAIYIFCCSSPDVDPAYLREKMGRHIVRIRDPSALALDIERQLQKRGIRTFNGVHGRPVAYTKGTTIHRTMDASQRAVLSITQKPTEYCPECEYRFFTILNQHPRGSVEEFLHVNLGVPLPYAEIIRK